MIDCTGVGKGGIPEVLEEPTGSGEGEGVGVGAFRGVGRVDASFKIRVWCRQGWIKSLIRPAVTFVIRSIFFA